MMPGWNLAWEGLPWWAIVAVCLCAGTVLALSARRLLARSLPGGRRLLLLRGVILALVIAMLAGPTVVRRIEVPVRVPLAVVADLSGSMGSTDGGARSRHDRAGAIAARVADDLGRDFILRWFSVAEGVTEGDPALLAAARPGSKETRLAEGLAGILEANPGLAGMVVLSDGTDTATPVAAAAALPLPVAGILIGPERPSPDLRIDRLELPPVLLLGKQATARVAVSAEGLSGTAIPVVLRSGRRVLATGSLAVKGSPFAGEVELPILPDVLGPWGIEAVAGPSSAEKVTENNRLSWTGTVQRPSTRTLFVAGAPDWTYELVRRTAKQDPSNDLVSFIILRGAWDQLDVSDRESALVPFPVETIFGKELPTFSLLMMHNFTPFPYLQPILAQNIADQIRRGTGLLWVGGPLAFAASEQLLAPIAAVLPFAVPYASAGYLPGTVEPVVTGSPHPIARAIEPLVGKGGVRLRGHNRITALDPEAAVLLTGKGADGTTFPLMLALGRGNARTVAVLADDLWRLAFREDDPLAQQRFDDFYRTVSGWLLDPWRYPLIDLSAPDGVIPPGQGVTVTAVPLDRDYRPTGARVAVTVSGPEGEPIPVTTSPMAGGEGTTATFTPGGPGLVVVRLDASEAGTKREAVRYLPVSARSAETDRPNPDPVMLAKLVGNDHLLRENDPDLVKKVREIVAGGKTRILAAEEKVYLWANLWFPMILIALLGVDWWLRRRMGLG
jgi:hypothetical protein